MTRVSPCVTLDMWLVFLIGFLVCCFFINARLDALEDACGVEQVEVGK